ncbi:MAG TPA: serine/threonine-protein kinase [Thermoanaerobaculia bacterium]|nr:serine/threonine-protein kinase [Thermoanaerobaculia bacterium]
MKPGDSLDGRYTIIDRLGAGGMGEVYKATHNFLGSTRVIKVVHPNISSNTDARDRFLREARAATKVQHQNVATLHDFASLPDGAHYMVWEFIAGENLSQRLRAKGTLPPRQAVRITLQALRGLEAIHRAGIVHRDISPENLMITADDEVKIIDLGVAKVEDTDAVSTTRTGIFVGKLRYAAPEQLGFMPEGEKVDTRADLYAMAMVLVELLTGRPPYEATSPHEYFMLHAVEPRKQTVSLPVEMPGSAALQAVLEKALARDRNQRYATAREFAAALEEIERTLPDAQDMATMATPVGDETMRVISQARTLERPEPPDTLHRETLRGTAPGEVTARTPLPAPPQAAPPAPATLLTPIPQAAPPPPPKLRAGVNPMYVVGFVLLIAVAVAALLLMPRQKRTGSIVQLPETTTTAAPATQTTPATTTQPPQVAEASVTVTSATADSTQLSAPITMTVPSITTTTPPVTATVAQIAPIPPPARPRPRQQARPVEPRPAPVEEEQMPAEPSVPAFSRAATYRDGGDGDANDRALAVLRRELRGTTTVALRAGGNTAELARALREQFPSINFEGEADVVIRFTGIHARAGAGRKRRGAQATVEKNGRVIFRYELPEEVYRVGDTSVEAFANVLGEAFQE